MQPYFFPYIGYFQLLNKVDEFVIYDNIEFSRKGWIHRNRILVNGLDAYITLPIKRDSDYLDVKERYLADTWPQERKKLLNRILESYRKAPEFEQVFSVIERAILYEDNNLFNFIFHVLKSICMHLEIKTPFVVSSIIPIDHELKGYEKVMSICKARNATSYINPIGGLKLYNREEFERNGIELNFIKTEGVIYKQFDAGFIHHLSIIDVLMFNTKEQVKNFINSHYTIIKN